ncbi:MAG TPA: hypothetical protein VJR93_03285 [Chthoniobacterales bacterium]|nr:hypothetical protein [Chthoniobacterales bacterium]
MASTAELGTRGLLAMRLLKRREREPAMKLPDIVETKLRDPEAIVLPRVTPVKKGEMVICYHCDGKSIGETTFPYSAAAYADWLRSMADALNQIAPTPAGSDKGS